MSSPEPFGSQKVEHGGSLHLHGDCTEPSNPTGSSEPVGSTPRPPPVWSGWELLGGVTRLRKSYKTDLA
jgi:hypothetical protein